MKKILFMLPICIYFFFVTHAQSFQPPATKKVSKEFSEHGKIRTDNYYWLSNTADSNVINHLKEENAYVDSFMKPVESLQKKIYNELVARIPARDESLPFQQKEYWYYSRFEEGKQYPYYARKKNLSDGKEQMVLDIPALATGHKIYLIRGRAVSGNSNELAYGVDTSGDRRSTLYFKNISSGTVYAESIPNTSGDYVWSSDNTTVYYVINDHTVRAYKVMQHKLGTDASADKDIYTEKDSTYSVSIYKSQNEKYIFINSSSTNSTEEWFMKAGDATARLTLIQPRTEHLEYGANSYDDDTFHIYTNQDAPNFKFVSVPVSNPSKKNWKDVIPADSNAYLEDVEVLKNYYVVQTKENGLTQIKIYNRSNHTTKKVDFGEEDYVANVGLASDNYNLDSIRYSFTSLATPNSQYMYNIVTGEKKLLKRQDVSGGFNADLYETKRIWSTSRDGVKVPMSLVYRKDKFKQDGSNPLLLYAYGSYGANSDPYFNSSVISLLDRGISFAITHVRGGQELGRQWFENGRILNKKNTFIDFVDAAQFLVTEKYTLADRMFANGGSAGGMLMGAITNMRPDLFKGVIAEVPWMDVITDMYNTDLPLTTLEYDQWGDPNKEEYYNYMMSWSPLDNVKPAVYPAILATGGLNDTQVPFYSPAKWVAKVRENNQGSNPVLFRVNMGAGHSGESGRYERQKLTSLKYAFILYELGMKE